MVRFSLQDVRKSVQRRGGELGVSLYFLRPGMLEEEIERLLAYHKNLLGQPERMFSLDEARACIGEYRLAHCLIATLSHWYSWRQREWATVVQEMSGGAELVAMNSPAQLRLALYTYVNNLYKGFLSAQSRSEALQTFAESYGLKIEELEYLLVLDSESEAILLQQSGQAPDAREVATLYNQWVFEAALFNSSSVRFVIDCRAFAVLPIEERTGAVVGSGVGAVIKRLCYLARKMGVYYDLAYASASFQDQSALLALTLYGPQEVTGAPQQYGIRLARLCRVLMGYSSRKNEQGQVRKKATLSSAIIEAQACIHFLQRAYIFRMDANLLQLLPSVKQQEERFSPEAAQLFDSSIEQKFAEAFIGSANSQAVDGWQLEREPEPLLLDQGIFIPDFAFTRAQQRIYLEILGYWTPTYRERKIQKLQQLRGRSDLLLAIPLEAKDAFSAIVKDFPIVFYDQQFSVTEVLQVLRVHYDNFSERLALLSVDEVRARVRREGLLPERICYKVLHCYRRTELQVMVERIKDEDITFGSGIGLYTQAWMMQVKEAFIAWLRVSGEVPLADAIDQLRSRWNALQTYEAPSAEMLLGNWPELIIRRTSIFDATVALQTDSKQETIVENSAAIRETSTETKRASREKRVAAKKHVPEQPEAVQRDLWVHE